MKKPVIFCVDDEKFVLDSLKAELKTSFGEEFTIETAESAQEALDTIGDLLSENHDLPVIITDYAMPHFKGDALLARVHKISPKTCKILITGQATLQGVTNSINNANLYRYIAKPWEPNDLILTVKEAIKSYNQEKQLELQIQQLLELSNMLEQKVEERTKEIIKVNDLLVDKQQEITTQNQELEKYRNHLEKLVVERTAELEKAKEKAELSDKLKTAFLANISHEISTPMNGILGFLDLLKLPGLEANKQQEYLEIIEKSSNQLLAIIKDIVEISKIETNQVKIKTAPVDIAKVLNNLYATFNQMLTYKKNVVIILSCLLPDNKKLYETDEVKLQQILTNLINNAVKFTSYGKIEFGCQPANNGNLEFFVNDSGIGIAPEYHDLVFERFRQVEIGYSKKYGGTGLGLAICKAYTELLGGKIWLDSDLGKGSSFRFMIPCKPVEENLLVDKSTNTGMDNFSESTILVAEDDDMNYSFLEIVLKHRKIALIKANNGKEAIELCKNHPEIDLVLMDIKMPYMNGYEATKQILRIRPSLPIIAQTAYAFSDDKQKALDSGCVDYIAKPIKREMLLDKINKHLMKK